MTTLVNIDRPRQYATPLYPVCNLRIEEQDSGRFVVSAGQRDTPQRSSINLSELEARELHEALARRFGSSCIACERQRTHDQWTAQATSDHAGLAAIANMDMPAILAKIGGVHELADYVRQLAGCSGEEDAAQLAEDWGLE